MILVIQYISIYRYTIYIAILKKVWLASVWLEVLL